MKVTKAERASRKRRAVATARITDAIAATIAEVGEMHGSELLWALHHVAGRLIAVELANDELTGGEAKP